MKKDKKCGNCMFLDRKDRSDIGGLIIAKCKVPDGTTVDGVSILNDYVELNAYCEKHSPK